MRAHASRCPCETGPRGVEERTDAVSTREEGPEPEVWRPWRVWEVRPFRPKVRGRVLRPELTTPAATQEVRPFSRAGPEEGGGVVPTTLAALEEPSIHACFGPRARDTLPAPLLLHFFKTPSTRSVPVPETSAAVRGEFRNPIRVRQETTRDEGRSHRESLGWTSCGAPLRGRGVGLGTHEQAERGSGVRGAGSMLPRLRLPDERFGAGSTPRPGAPTLFHRFRTHGYRTCVGRLRSGGMLRSQSSGASEQGRPPGSPRRAPGRVGGGRVPNVHGAFFRGPALAHDAEALEQAVRLVRDATSDVLVGESSVVPGRRRRGGPTLASRQGLDRGGSRRHQAHVRSGRRASSAGVGEPRVPGGGR